jgi:hypothetical protein
MNFKEPQGQLARWLEELSQLNMEIQHPLPLELFWTPLILSHPSLFPASPVETQISSDFLSGSVATNGKILT